MQSKSILWVFILAMLVSFSHPVQSQIRSDEIIQARAALVASEAYRVSDRADTALGHYALSPDAIPVRGGLVTSATLSGSPTMVSSITLTGGLSERYSESPQTAFAVSTGIAGSEAPAPGHALGDRSAIPDRATLSITLEPEPELSMLYITWNVSTTEIKPFADLGFADVFSISVSDVQERRTLVELDTNDSRLEPVSNTRAEGSMFNLYAEQPELLPSTYGKGLPAARISGWRTTGFAIDSSGPVEIEIQLRDGLDGLMDTEVLIHEIALTAFIAPQFRSIASESDTQRGLPPQSVCLPAFGQCNILFPFRGQTAGQNQPPIPPRFCTISEESRANESFDLRTPFESRGPFITRLTADGNTRWPLNLVATDSNVSEVEFTMFDSTPPQDGGLGEFDSFDRLQTITIPASEVSPGFWGAEVQYYVPDTYFSDDLDIANEFEQRSVFVDACLKDLMGNTRLCARREVQLYRPDIILMHGLWSGEDTWSSENEDEEPFQNLGVSLPEIPDYLSTSAASIAENRYEPRDAMARACEENALASIRGTQFDYVGHSMGGLLARVYLYQVAPFRTINRLYTMNTPHLGSPLATLLLNMRDNLSEPLRSIVIARMELSGRSVFGGAIDDLAEGSVALREIPFTPVLSHALAGIGGQSLDSYELTNIVLLDGYTVLRFFTNFTFAFDGQHDTVVSRESQIGGIVSGAFSLFDGQESIHTSATTSPQYAARLFCKGPTCPGDPVGIGRNDLMNKSGTGAFGFFPSPDGLMPPNRVVSDLAVSSQGSTVTEMGISLVVSGGLAVQPGDMVNITVESIAPFVADSVILFSEFDIVIDDAVPLEFALQVPQDLIGDLEITAIAKDSQGNFATSAITVLSSQTSATLTEIRVNPVSVYLGGSEDVRTLSVQGLYDDGIERTITSPATGTTYMSSDPNIVTVSAEGVLRPESNGMATVIVTNGSVQDSIPVDVRGVISIVFSDGFESTPAAR